MWEVKSSHLLNHVALKGQFAQITLKNVILPSGDEWISLRTEQKLTTVQSTGRRRQGVWLSFVDLLHNNHLNITVVILLIFLKI